MYWFLAAVFAIWASTRFYLRGKNHRQFDRPRPLPFLDRPGASEELNSPIERLGEISVLAAGTPRRQRLALLRQYLDEMGDDVVFDGEIIAVDRDGIRGEWLVPRDCDPAQRMLYLHGGAFVMGSPRSHRAITGCYARLLGGPVFALDYRLLPEHPRRLGIEDCCRAYRWILDQGPAGPQPLESLFTSGDSAGGNLVLMLSAWVRDQGLRAPNAVIALSPATDTTFASPSLRGNVATDHMLGPQFGKLAKIPSGLWLWLALFNNRCSPSSPRVSPLHGDLSGLPPTLLHASLDEMLLDDSIRYVNKAKTQGSPVEIQVWPHMLHVWHIYERELPEAKEAFAEIARFIDRHRSSNVPGAAA